MTPYELVQTSSSVRNLSTHSYLVLYEEAYSPESNIPGDVYLYTTRQWLRRYILDAEEANPSMATLANKNSRLTHISLIAEDVDESVEFYEDILGCEQIPTPIFGHQEDFETDEQIDFQILRIGDHQLHLWNDPAREIERIQFAHVGIHVDDFEDVYRKAEEQDAFAAIGKTTSPPRVFEFNGNAQMYLSDPTGNVLEVDHPDIHALDQSIFAEVVTRELSGPSTGIYTEHVLRSASQSERT